MEEYLRNLLKDANVHQHDSFMWAMDKMFYNSLYPAPKEFATHVHAIVLKIKSEKFPESNINTAFPANNVEM